METPIVVASFYQLMSDANGFREDRRELIRESVKVSRTWADKINSQCTACGKYYEIDEQATADYYESGKAVMAERAEAEEAKSAVSEALIDVVKQVNKPKAKKSKKSKKVEIEIKEVDTSDKSDESNDESKE